MIANISLGKTILFVNDRNNLYQNRAVKFLWGGGHLEGGCRILFPALFHLPCVNRRYISIIGIYS